ncbi:MAG: hypothetical protein FJ122_08780 [Deltaproteobacteria bacterium]|nr:hypothetical protein [Deltaproteobacteria bacterium]
MSVILDVLKKLDREKSSRRSAAANIALEILKPDPRPQKRSALYLAAIGLTALAAAAVTYALMGFGVMNPPTTTRQETAQAPHRPDPLSVSSLLPARAPSALNRKAAPAQLSIDPAKSPPASGHKVTPAQLPPEEPKNPPASIHKAMPAPPLPEPNRETREETNRVPPEPPTPAENRITTTVAPTEKMTSLTPPQPTPERSGAAQPSLKISAIIWYDDPSRRFAMINDTMTREGSIIEEVTVEEIYPNRVRFSHHGRQFEISVK